VSGHPASIGAGIVGVTAGTPAAAVGLEPAMWSCRSAPMPSPQQQASG